MTPAGLRAAALAAAEDAAVYRRWAETPPPRPCFAVAVCGGVCGWSADAVGDRLARLLRRKLPTHNVRVMAAPTRGAADHAVRWAFHAGCLAGTLGLSRPTWGRAAEFRCAWELLSTVDALCVFEPPDLVARYAMDLAPLLPGPDGSPGGGVRVVRLAAG